MMRRVRSLGTSPEADLLPSVSGRASSDKLLKRRKSVAGNVVLASVAIIMVFALFTVVRMGGKHEAHGASGEHHHHDGHGAHHDTHWDHDHHGASHEHEGGWDSHRNLMEQRRHAKGDGHQGGHHDSHHENHHVHGSHEHHAHDGHDAHAHHDHGHYGHAMDDHYGHYDHGDWHPEYDEDLQGWHQEQEALPEPAEGANHHADHAHAGTHLHHQEHAKAEGLYALEAVDIDGNTRHLSEFAGRVTLVVNVASACGFTDANYRGLQATYEKYHPHGLSVIAFPSNQFGGQEPGSAAEIKAFATGKYNVTFPLFAKVDVNGPHTHPVYEYLRRNLPVDQGGGGGQGAGKDLIWNFQKILVDQRGRPVRLITQAWDTADVENAVYELLLAGEKEYEAAAAAAHAAHAGEHGAAHDQHWQEQHGGAHEAHGHVHEAHAHEGHGHEGHDQHWQEHHGGAHEAHGHEAHGHEAPGHEGHGHDVHGHGHEGHGHEQHVQQQHH